MCHLPLCTRTLLWLPTKLLPMLEFELCGIGGCGCDSPNPGEWDVGFISVDGPRELDKLVYVIGHVDVIRPTNVDVFGWANVDTSIVSMPNGATMDADTTDVKATVKDEEWLLEVEVWFQHYWFQLTPLEMEEVLAHMKSLQRFLASQQLL